MRISGLGSLTMGMLLLNGESREESAMHFFAAALNTACMPWLAGAGRDDVRAQLERGGWQGLEDGAFAKNGDWGEVVVALTDLAGTRNTRGCDVRVRTNEEPWTTIELTTAAQAWIAHLYPTAERERSTSAIFDGQSARVAVWDGGHARVTMTSFLWKQIPPRFDVALTAR
ncbi:MAG: hypothetical protein GC190_10930 [Alphaproteobacteria bacterium]|nr:hypothetical protein [Alphaproteobacteria bacterium]